MMSDCEPPVSEDAVGKGLIYRVLLQPKFWCAFLIISLGVSLGIQAWRNPRRVFEQGMLAVQEKDTARIDSAIRFLDELPRYSKHSDFFRAFLAVQNGDFERGLQLAMLAREHPDIANQASVLAGEAAYKLGAAGNAKILWEKVLLNDPEYVPAHQWLGALYYDIGAMNDAIYHLEQVSRLRPDDPRPDRLMGLMNRDYERPEIAVRHYKESLKRDPNQEGADTVRLEFAESHIKLREYEEALAILEQCQPTPKRDIFIIRSRLNLGMLEEVRGMAEALVDTRGPERTEALQLNAEIALADGSPEKAAQFLESAIQSDPFSHAVRTQYAQVLGRMGNAEASREQSKIAEDLQERWQKFSDLQIDAINVPTDANIRCEIGRLAKDLGKPELAIVWYRAALGIDPTNRIAAEALAELSRNTPISTSTP